MEVSYNASTGVVGDTIGGLTAPVVGLISIFLLIYTLIKQNESSDRQMRFMRDKKFENTLFNLLTEQRDISKSLSASFHGLSDKDASKKIIIRIYGNECFAMAEYELRQLFSSLESGQYYNHYDASEVIGMMKYLEDSLLHGSNLPYEEKGIMRAREKK